MPLSLLLKPHEYGPYFDLVLFFPLEYPQLYFDSSGGLLPNTEQGFHGVIGNPPWNNIKANAKEFVTLHEELFGERVSKFSMNSRDFDRFFIEKLKSNEIHEKWQNYTGLIQFISNRYKLDYSGDKSLQKTFLERFLELSKEEFSILVPSNFHTDEGSYNLRKEIIEKWNLNELISFENRANSWFPDIDSRFKFDLLEVSKHKKKSLLAKFYVKDWEEIAEKFEYPVELIEKMSPNVFGFIEFRSKRDVNVASKIRGKHKLLSETGVRIGREFDKTSKKYPNQLFKGEDRSRKLYEGKMIHQYNSNFSEGDYLVNESIARTILTERELMRISRFLNEVMKTQKTFEKKAFAETLNELEGRISDKSWKLDYESERLVFRRIGRSTDERSLISTVIPAGTFIDDSLAQIAPWRYELDKDKLIQKNLEDFSFYLMALLNSFVLDYYIRLRISANLNFFFIYELPIPSVSNELYSEIVKISRSLMSNNAKAERAKLEAKIAKEAFRLERNDMEYILNTFTFGDIDQQLISLILEEF